MPVHNADIATVLNRVADLLEIEGANVFRIRAYRNAARTIASLPWSVAEVLAEGEDLPKLPGIGEDLAGKIKEIATTGTLSQLEEIERRIPAALTQLMKIPSLGPKRVQAIYQKLNITTLDELEKAAREGKIRALFGFGQKTEEKIIEEIEQKKEKKERIKLPVAEEVAQSIVNYLRQVSGVSEVVVAGSYRRRKEVVADLDILAVASQDSPIMQRFINYEDVDRVVARGETKSTVLLRSGLQVDLRVVPKESYGAALHYFTGSSTHNIAIRKLGLKAGLKINEYGIFRAEERIGGREEEDVFRSVGLPFIEPELREGRGEIEAAARHMLPRLISLADIRGDLHLHTTATDGRFSLEEMVEAAIRKNYQYVAITDHSRHVSVAHGLDARQILQQIEAIDRLNKRLEGKIRVLKGVELDILEDGSLDLPDEVLKLLDLTVCSVHYNFNLPLEKQTERIIRAMDNPYFNILAHPTGRLINERKPYEVDMERLIEAARQRGCFMELNAHPDRLDLNDIHCKMAKEMGVKIAVSTDAHNLTDLDFMRYGVDQARRGWLEPEDVLNTRDWPKLQQLLKRR
ncbi:MAG: DNA polymerase/3'-5' exonuclease PolX [bacterium]|nr:DNA polymerase/3'-5' exonuclease PolX [bacterium]